MTNPEEALQHAQEEVEATAGPHNPAIMYGFSIFQMSDDRPVVHVTGEPDMGQLQRLLGSALANLNAEITAEKVVDKMRRKTIITP